MQSYGHMTPEEVQERLAKAEEILKSDSPEVQRTRLYLHFKGGIYHALHSRVLDTDSGKYRVVYEHLWPHAHGLFVRDEAEFYGHLDFPGQGSIRRFRSVQDF